MSGSDHFKKRSHILYQVHLYVQVREVIMKTTVKVLDLCGTKYLNFSVNERMENNKDFLSHTLLFRPTGAK